MSSDFPERNLGIREGPFDAYDTKESIHYMTDRFLSRTGLLGYAYHFRIGAFLARRPFGKKQVEFLKRAHREEDTQSENRWASNSVWDTFNNVNKSKNLRRKYEYDKLNREGDRGRWQIFWRQNWRIHVIVLCCFLGAVIQGWEESAVNGAQLYYQVDFNIKDRPALVGLITSAPSLMCLLSCSLTGPLNHYLGRKGTIMVCCVFCFASSLGQALSETWTQLLVCRLLLGLGIGPKIATIPIYAAENMPSEGIRSAVIESWHIGTAFGIMLGYVITYEFNELVNQWRFMIGSPLIASILLFFLMVLLPESPRWYLLNAHRLEGRNLLSNRLAIEKQYEHAFYALRTLRHTKIQAARDLLYIDSWLRIEQLPETPHNLGENRAGIGLGRIPWRAWFQNTVELRRQPRCCRAMTAALIFMGLQSLCGMNVLAYYSSPVFKDSIPNSSVVTGIEIIQDDIWIMTTENMRKVNVTTVNTRKDQIALAYSLGFGVINFGVAVLAAFLIAKVGRRLLLLITFPLMSLFQLAIGLSFGSFPVVDKHRHSAIVIFAYLFCVAYSIGEGPVPLVYVSECLPLEVRDTGIGILTSIYGGLNSLVTLTWPLMYHAWKPQGSFGFSALLNFIGWFLILFLVPETSRYTLEGLDEVFSQDTSGLIRIGWAQLKWLTTGVGSKKRDSGRWVQSDYPGPVPPVTFRDEQEIEDCGDVASSSKVTKLTLESQTSHDPQHVSRQVDLSPGLSQRLYEADPLPTNHLAAVNDLSVQNQTQSPITAKTDEEAGLRPLRLHENSSPARSSTASSDSHQDLVGFDARVTCLENKLVRLRWTCSCNHTFQIDVFEHEKGAALAAIQELDQPNRGRDESSGPFHRLFQFLVRIRFLLYIFSYKRETNETLPISNPLPTKADDMIQTRLNPANPDPERYVCVCFPGMTYKKYLHHVDVNKATDDQHLFAAMQKKYYDWKPLWRRIFTLRTLARVEYSEFKIYHNNLVTIKDDWRDRFPHGHEPGEWSYNPTSRDMTPYLIDDVLTHYIHSPQHAKIGKYFWNRIPKKVFCKLECPNDEPFKVGWGLYFVEEFSQFYLMLILIPVLVTGIALAIWYCTQFQKSFADGATVVSGFVAVVMYLFCVAQGWCKQKGTL